MIDHESLEGVAQELIPQDAQEVIKRVYDPPLTLGDGSILYMEFTIIGSNGEEASLEVSTVGDVIEVFRETINMPIAALPQTPITRAATLDWLSSDAMRLTEASYEKQPSKCWRCDARWEETEVGLCIACHQALISKVG